MLATDGMLTKVFADQSLACWRVWLGLLTAIASGRNAERTRSTVTSGRALLRGSRAAGRGGRAPIARTNPHFRPSKTLNNCYLLFNNGGGCYGCAWTPHRRQRPRSTTALKRNRLVLEQARAVGPLGEAKNTRLSGRVPAGLIERQRSGLTYLPIPNFQSSRCRAWRLKTISALVLSGAREASRQISILPFDLQERCGG